MSRAARRLGLLAALALGGCVTVLPKATPVQLYRFGPPDAEGVTVISAIPPVARRVMLASLRLPPSAAGDGILTTTGDQAAYVGGARWLEPASVLFQEDVKAAFAGRARARPGGVILIDPGQTSEPSAVLRLDVSRFETRYPRNGGAPSVVVSLRATLDRPDGSPLTARDFVADEPASADRMDVIVAAYDTAVTAVVNELADWTAAAAPTPTQAQGTAP